MANHYHSQSESESESESKSQLYKYIKTLENITIKNNLLQKCRYSAHNVFIL